MLREFAHAFRPIADARLTARAVALSAIVLTLALLPACGIKGPLKPAPSAPSATSVPQNPGDTILVKPPDQPAVTAPPPIPPPVRP